MAFNERFDYDDVLMRALTIGMLDTLHKKVFITQVVSREETREIPIPFFYYNYGSERFIQDFYAFKTGECEELTFAEGAADPVPRGHIHINTVGINSAALTNKYVRGTYTKVGDGKVEAFSAFLHPVPLTVSVEVEIMSNGLTEAFKIFQAIVSTFYRAQSFSISYMGFRVECLMGFSQEYTIDKPTSFTYGDDSSITLKFPLEVETYLPVIDKTSELRRTATMTGGFGNEVYEVSGVSGTFSKLVFDEENVDIMMTRILESRGGETNRFEVFIPGQSEGDPRDQEPTEPDSEI